MSLPPLTIIPAGAGSGKTFTIQTRLYEWIKAGKIKADRIVAVTFTEAAAAEMRNRIRTQLVEEGLLEDALKLDQAYITTIHGFGLRLLTEYAFEAGVSPSPRLLNEDEEKTLIRLALSETKEADGVLDDLQKFGYRYDFNSGKGPEDLFRDKILFLLSKFRSLGKLAKDDRILAHALKKLKTTYGPTGDPALLKLALLVAVQDLLRRFPADLSPLFDKKTVVETFRGDYRALKRAEKGDTLDTDWRLWQQLRGLRQSKGGSPTPDGYDDLADNVITAAEGLIQHPGPRQEAEVLLSSLLLGSQDCLLRYGESKREKGLVDYTDMLAVAFQLLSRNQEALTDLKNRVDCLVIDEFQDTNPLQFSLMWALQRAGVPTLIVGDLKQAIMRFQNADSRLMAQLQKDFQEYLDPLENNWRSSAALMAWVNQIGAGLFGADYTHLTPKAAFETQLSPLEIIDIPKRAKKDGNYIIAQQTVARIRDLLEAGDQLVYDRHTKEMRPLRGSDIAILCPINAHLDHYARALRAIGIQPQLEEDGWFESRIVQLLYYCLSYVADNEDRHAALYLAVTELGHYDLKTAVSTLVDGVPLQEPVLEGLQEVSLQCADLAVDAILQEIIVKLDLFNIIASWPDSTQARANVLRLLGETSAFIGANREALASGGYYGSGLKTFLAWLKSRAEQENSQPAPRVVDENGVQLMTWHKSKGKEWPVVAVCGSYRDIKARLPSFDVVYEDFSDLGTILEKAAIEITPDFVAPETKEAFLAPLQEAAIDDALRLLYVVLTRSRDKLILEWPSFLKSEKVTYWNLLTERAQISIDKNKMRVGAVSFDCRINQGDSEALPEFAETGADDNTTLPTVGRRAIVKGALPTDLTPESITPSSRHGAEEAKVEIQTIQYGKGLDIEMAVAGAERGIILHRCFEVLSDRQLDPAVLANATGYEFPADQQTAVVGAVSDFDKWLATLKPVSIGKEVPILVTNEAGSVVVGEIDLLVETEEGFWIIDHKSDQTGDLEERFQHYLPQLKAYGDAVNQTATGRQVVGYVVNWLSTGYLSVMKE